MALVDRDGAATEKAASGPRAPTNSAYGPGGWPQSVGAILIQNVFRGYDLQVEDLIVKDGEGVAEVARSQVNVELEVLGARLSAEGIPSLIVNANSNRMGPQFSNAAGGSRLLVASQYEKDAKQIIALVKAGAFALKEGDDVG